MIASSFIYESTILPIPPSELFSIIDDCFELFMVVLPSGSWYSDFSTVLSIAALSGLTMPTILILLFDVISSFAGKLLHKSVVHRQAIPDPEPSSLMSFSTQFVFGTKGSLIVPSKTSVLKHSRIVAESNADVSYQYQVVISCIEHKILVLVRCQHHESQISIPQGVPPKMPSFCWNWLRRGTFFLGYLVGTFFSAGLEPCIHETRFIC